MLPHVSIFYSMWIRHLEKNLEHFFEKNAAKTWKYAQIDAKNAWDIYHDFYSNLLKNGGHVDAECFFLCTCAMDLKLFREASVGPKEGFELSHHPPTTYRSLHRLTSAQMASLLVDSWKKATLRCFEISSWFSLENGDHIDADFFFCVCAMDLKLFREASVGPNECFELSHHPPTTYTNTSL